MVAAVPSQFRSITDKNELGGHGTIGLYTYNYKYVMQYYLPSIMVFLFPG